MTLFVVLNSEEYHSVSDATVEYFEFRSPTLSATTWSQKVSAPELVTLGIRPLIARSPLACKLFMIRI
jgi:hypothetical protein